MGGTVSNLSMHIYVGVHVAMFQKDRMINALSVVYVCDGGISEKNAAASKLSKKFLLLRRYIVSFIA